MKYLSAIPFLTVISAVAGQEPYAADGWTYVGCVPADLEKFPIQVDFFVQPTPQECQEACALYGFAALTP